MSIFIERFILAILAALVVLLAVTNPMKFSATARIIGVIVIVILAGVAAFYSERIQRKRVQREPSQRGERDAKAAITASPAAPDPSPAARPEVKETEQEERIFVGDGITPEYLLGFFQQHTDVQAKNATKDYVGKWMKVSGQVGNVVSTSPAFAQVTFERQRSSPVEWVDYITVYMYFRGSWRDRAIILKRGDTITTIGQIREIEAVNLHLDHCELFR